MPNEPKPRLFDVFAALDRHYAQCAEAFDARFPGGVRVHMQGGTSGWVSDARFVRADGGGSRVERYTDEEYERECERLEQHPLEWLVTQIHVASGLLPGKIKEDTRSAVKRHVASVEGGLEVRTQRDGTSEDKFRELQTCFHGYDTDGSTQEWLRELWAWWPDISTEAGLAKLPESDAVSTSGELESAGEPVPLRARKAYRQYQRAAKALGTTDPTDREAYDALAGAHAAAGEANDLPSFATWQRYVREHRRLTGTQKNTRRTGRAETTQRFARVEDIEPQSLPNRVRPRWADG